MQKTGGEIIIDYLIAQGVEYVIGIPGHGCLGLFDALRDRREKGLIQYIQVKQEMCGAHMADGYYRASGKPLAVLTSIGAGAINSMLGVATSFIDSTAVFVLTGDAHVHMRGTGILQEFDRYYDSDFISSMRPIAKRCWRVESLRQLPRIVRRAYDTMLKGRRGPVVLSVPMDVQSEAMDVPDGYFTASKRPDGPGVAQEQINRAKQLILGAKRPVILAGGGTYYARSTDLLVRFADRIGAAVVTTMASKSVFPEDHPLYAFHGGSKGTEVGNAITRSADLVIALGCRFADETTSSYKQGVTYNFPQTRLIHVDIDAGEIGKNYPPTLGIVSDASAFMRQMLDAIETPIETDARAQYQNELRSLRDIWRAKIEQNALAPFAGITISRLLHELKKSLPDDAIIVSSSGNTQAQLLQEYVFSTPGACITTGGFSTMGFAMPAALGVRLYEHKRPIISICGDGDFLMTMQEMSVAVQYGLPIVMIVANNRGWMAIKDLQMDAYGEEYAFGNDFERPDGSLYTPDFVQAAEAFGLTACRVERPEELPKAIEKALAAGAPVLIEVTVNRDYPQSGGNAVGWWDVPVPVYIADKREAYDRAAQGEQLF